MLSESEMGTDHIPNYTSDKEYNDWWLIKRFHKDCHRLQGDPWADSKQEFRMRRGGGFSSWGVLSFRIQYGSSDEIGAFMRLTNSYCIMGGEPQRYEKIHRVIQDDLGEIPVINTSLAGCNVVGRLCVGNEKGLLLPEHIYDTELVLINETLPDSIKISKIEDKLSALGNVIVCNDNIALIHPDIDRNTEEIIADTLQVEVFRHMIANNPVVGSHCVLNNMGGMVNVDISTDDLENLSSLLEMSLTAGTVNRGNKLVGSGIVANDYYAYAGMKTTASEFKVLENALFRTKVQ